MAVAKSKAAPRGKAAGKKSTKSAKRVGDVLGLGAARPPKKPIESGSDADAARRRRQKGMERGERRRTKPHLPPARVRG